MTIGSNLKKARENKKLSQIDVANYLNISRQSISKWENDRTIPDIDNLIKLSDLYELSIDELLKNKILINQNDIIPEQIKNLLDDHEWIMLLILCILLSIAAPLGLIFTPLILFRNRKNVIYHKLIIFACIICIIINCYCLLIYIGDYLHMQQEIEVINTNL